MSDTGCGCYRRATQASPGTFCILHLTANLHMRRNVCDWAQCWDLYGTAEYIVNRGFTRVTLQLPDELLYQAFRLSTSVQDACRKHGASIKVCDLLCLVLGTSSHQYSDVERPAGLVANRQAHGSAKRLHRSSLWQSLKPD